MKKNLVMITVLVLAGILFFQHVEKQRLTKPPDKPSVKETGPEGVALPAGDYTRLSSGASDMRPAQFGDCVKSVKDVTADFENMWDDFTGKKGGKTGFTEDDIKATSALMSEYYSCKALASRDVKFCETLSNRGSTIFTPRYVCREKYNFLSYAGYLAGKTDSAASCEEYLTEDRRRGLGVSSKEICKAASKGLESLCENLFENPLKNSCRGHFPKAEADCDKSNPRCGETLAIYSALKAGSPSRCPEGYKEQCEAFINRDEAPCALVKGRLIMTFCNISRKIETAKEEQKRKEENEKTLAETNKRIREDKKAFKDEKK